MRLREEEQNICPRCEDTANHTKEADHLLDLDQQIDDVHAESGADIVCLVGEQTIQSGHGRAEQVEYHNGPKARWT